MAFYMWMSAQDAFKDIACNPSRQASHAELDIALMRYLNHRYLTGHSVFKARATVRAVLFWMSANLSTTLRFNRTRLVLKDYIELAKEHRHGGCPWASTLLRGFTRASLYSHEGAEGAVAFLLKVLATHTRRRPRAAVGDEERLLDAWLLDAWQQWLLTHGAQDDDAWLLDFVRGLQQEYKTTSRMDPVFAVAFRRFATLVRLAPRPGGGAATSSSATQAPRPGGGAAHTVKGTPTGGPTPRQLYRAGLALSFLRSLFN